MQRLLQNFECRIFLLESHATRVGLGTNIFRRPSTFSIRDKFKACQNSKNALYADDSDSHSSSKDVAQAEYKINDDLKHMRINQ